LKFLETYDTRKTAQIAH